MSMAFLRQATFPSPLLSAIPLQIKKAHSFRFSPTKLCNLIKNFIQIWISARRILRCINEIGTPLAK